MSFVALVLYIGCYQFCVVNVEPRGTVYFPLWAEGGLADMISDAGGRAAAIEKFGRYAVYEATKGGNALPAILTTAVFLLLYTSVFTSLTWTFGLPATHEAPGGDAFCERLIGTFRRECLDFLIPLNDRHLRKITTEFVRHYNRGRPHSALGPEIPEPSQAKVPASVHRHQLPAGPRIASIPVLGGLHHEYRLEKEAA